MSFILLVILHTKLTKMAVLVGDFWCKLCGSNEIIPVDAGISQAAIFNLISLE